MLDPLFLIVDRLRYRLYRIQSMLDMFPHDLNGSLRVSIYNNTKMVHLPT